jgi:serpin B
MDIFGRLERWLDRRSDGVRQRARGQTPGLSIPGAEAPRPAEARPRTRADRTDHRERSSPLAFMFEEPTPPPRMPSIPTEPPEPGTAFAFALYAALKDTPGNLCFSPLSVRALLSLVCEAARGETGTQMREVLRLPAQGHLPLALIGGVQARLSATGVLSMANALWVDSRVTLLPEYVETLQGAVDCTIASADFSGDPYNAAGRINGWVRERTKGEVTHIVESSDFDALTRLVLANAVFFKDVWRSPFPKHSTEDGAFHLPDGRTVTIPLMKAGITAPYVEAQGLQVLALPYSSAPLSLVVLLPERADGLASLESQLSSDGVGTWLARARERSVYVVLPRLSIDSGVVDWTALLQGLGMPLPFAREADLSGLDGVSPPDPSALSIASLLHRARVSLNETGTVAAAATVAPGSVGATPGFRMRNRVPEFRADRPFVFAIRDDHTGAIVFLGRVVNPLE